MTGTKAERPHSALLPGLLTLVSGALITIASLIVASTISHADTGYTVEGSVRSSRGLTTSGLVEFFSACSTDDRVLTPDISADYTWGNYRLTAPAGTYYVRITPVYGSRALPSWNGAAAECADSQAVTVSGNSTINLTAAAGWDISGDVSTSRWSVNSGYVHIYSQCSTKYPVADARIIDGRYYATVPTGSFKMAISPATGTGLFSWHRAASTCQTATAISVSEDGTHDVEAIAGLVLHGDVSSPNGPITSGTVYAFSTCGADPIAQTYFQGSSFNLSLSAGTYRIQVVPHGASGATTSWHPAKTTCADATPVEVSGDTSINVSLLPGWNVTGQVSKATGKVNQGYVAFYADCKSPPVAGDNFYGSYAISVPTGTYKVQISDGSSRPTVHSWHPTKQTCEEADTISVTQNITQNLRVRALVTVPGSVTAGTVPISQGEVYFFTSCERAESGYPPDATATLTDGRFSVTLLEARYYAFIAPSSGQQVATSWHPGVRDCADATPITVRYGQEIALRAPVIAEISGSVSMQGRPLMAGGVRFLADCDQAPLVFYEVKDGRYSATILPGRYKVEIFTDEGVKSWHSAAATCDEGEWVTVTGGMTLDLSGLFRVKVSGRVLNAGTPITTGSVAFFTSCAAAAVNDETNSAPVENGVFTVPLPLGRYVVRTIRSEGISTTHLSWHSERLTCDDGDAITIAEDTTIDLKALPTRLLSGQVTSPLGPVASGGVTAFSDCNTPSGGSIIDRGRYRMLVPRGTHRIEVVPSADSGAASKWHEDATNCGDASPVAITDDTVLDLTVTTGFPVSGSISGTSSTGGTLEFYTSCDAAKPAYKANVSNSRYQAQLPTGTYRVSLWTYSATQLWHGPGASCEHSTPVTITGASALDIAVHDSVTLSGSVSSNLGALDSGEVRIYTQCMSNQPIMPAYTTAFRDGRYSLTVRPGIYRVQVLPSGDAALPSWHPGTADCTQATPILMAEDTTVGIRVQVPEQVTINGEVTSPSGPVSSGEVSWFSDCTAPPVASTTIRSNGYSLPLRPGTYRVRIRPTNTAAITSWHENQLTCASATPITVSGSRYQQLVAAVKQTEGPDGGNTDPGNPGNPTTNDQQRRAQTRPKVARRMTVGKTTKLSPATKEGQRLMWRSRTVRKCRVATLRLKAVRKGYCRITATAVGTHDLKPFRARFTVRVLR